jgi:hypothetical protein
MMPRDGKPAWAERARRPRDEWTEPGGAGSTVGARRAKLQVTEGE